MSSDEESLFIIGITKEEAINLGNKFNQYSIICKHDGVCEEIFTKQFSIDGMEVGDVIRTFNIDGNKIFNVNDAKAIFDHRAVGPVSVIKRGGKHTKTPFQFREVESFELYEVFDPKPSTFQTKKIKSRIF